jgi:hypothetical protein
MKKRLLITMGCSWTEGVGCYDYSKIMNRKNPIEFSESEHRYQTNRFHQLGWPNRLGKKLGYDKVINLGLGGSSNSTHVKLFVERILPMDLSEWEVLVIWMMTEPTRFSFYNGLVNFDYTPSINVKKTPLETAYLQEIDLPLYSSLYDQIFYMKLMEQICENNGYDLLFTSWNNSSQGLYKIYPSDKYIHKKWVDINPRKSSHFSSICGHPNEKGYEWIANRLIEGINKNHPQYKGESKNDIEWEWLGSRIVHSIDNDTFI